MSVVKKIGAVGTVAVILATAGCATSADPVEGESAEGITIGVSFDRLNDAFRIGEKKYLDLYAEELGVTLIYQDAQSDAQTQSSQIQSFIAQGVDGIIQIPWDTQAVAADIAAAAEAGIPLGIIDQQPADTSDVFFYVGGNPTADGRIAAEFLIDAVDGAELKVLELQGGLNNINGIERSAGFQDAIATAPNITIVASSPTDWQPEAALAATQNALQAHPDLGAVYAPWTGALPAVYNALDAAGKLTEVGEPGHVWTVAINGDEIGCRYVSENMLAVDIATDLPEMARQVLDAVIAGIDGEVPAENVVLLDGVPYTPENLESKRDMIWGCS